MSFLEVNRADVNDAANTLKKILTLSTIIVILFCSYSVIKSGYIQAKAALSQVLLNYAWFESQQSSSHDSVRSVKPWPWADTWPILKLKVPAIDEAMIILANSSGQSLAFGPGLHTAGVWPGEQGHSIIAGHRDTHFKHIKQLIIGQQIIIERIDGTELTFEIDRIEVANSDREQPNMNISEQRLTLVTCVKPNDRHENSPFRYLVSAILVS